MPESKVRKEAKSKTRKEQAEELAKARKERKERKRIAGGTERRWVPWLFCIVGLLGVMWMVTWNLAGTYIGFMRSLGEWNILIALGLIISSFMLATLWK